MSALLLLRDDPGFTRGLILVDRARRIAVVMVWIDPAQGDLRPWLLLTAMDRSQRMTFR